MKKLKKTIGMLLLGFLTISALKAIVPSYLTYAETYPKLSENKIVNNPKKTWTIKFNKPINEDNITSKNIYIKDTEGNILSTDIKISENKKLITIIPKDSYDSSKNYYLYISDNIKSIDNEYLTDSIEVPFLYELKDEVIDILNPEKFESEASSNIINNGRRDYFPRWRTTVSSYLTPNSDNTFSLVDCNLMDQHIIIKNYGKNFKLIDSKSIEAELPIFGGYYSGEKYNYIAFGQLNLEENDKKEVIRIVKYDKNFKRLGSVSLTGKQCYTTTPFDAGSGRMAENGNKLVFHTARERYTTEDGENHQSQLTIIVDTEKMQVINNTGKFQDNHVSHSFDQYALFDGDALLLLDHGDGYPRSVVLSKETENGYTSTDLFEIPGEIGANCTGVSIGGFEISSDNYIVAMNTIDHSLVSEYTSFKMVGLDIDQRDIIVCTLPKDNMRSEPKQITLGKYVGTDKIASIPQIVKVSDENLVVLWQECNLNKTNMTTTLGNLRYVIIDKDGQPKGDVKSVSDFRLSDCKPIVFDNKIIWYTDSVEYGVGKPYTRTIYSMPITFK